MANFLLLGEPAHLRSFVASARDGHRWYVLAEDREDFPGEERIEVVDDSYRLPPRLDGVFELSCADDGRKHLNLAMIAEIASADTIVFSNALTMTGTAASAILNGSLPVVAVSFIPHLYATSSLLEVAPALQTTSDDLDRALDLLNGSIGKEVEVVVDRVGLVSARVLAMVMNEAAFALMEGVADPDDIDIAMRLGTNYPEGPLRWADRIGVDIVLGILDALYSEYREDRYRPCVLLRQYARAQRTFHDVAA